MILGRRPRPARPLAPRMDLAGPSASAEIDGQAHPLGAGAQERVRQRGPRAWLPGSWRLVAIRSQGTRSTAVFRRRRCHRLLSVTMGTDERRLVSCLP